MRLKKGSYLYIVGMLFLFWSSLLSLASFVFSLIFSRGPAVFSPILQSFCGDFAGSTVSLIMSGCFVPISLFLTVLIVYYGIKTNSLAVPLRVVGITILPLSFAVMLAIWFLFEKEGTFTTLALRLMRAVPPFLFGVHLIRVSMNLKNSRMLTVFFGAMSGYSAFSGFGLEKILYGSFSDLLDGSFYGWLSVFLFSLSLCLFFTGICFCVGGCQRRSKKRGLSKGSSALPTEEACNDTRKTAKDGTESIV